MPNRKSKTAKKVRKLADFGPIPSWRKKSKEIVVKLGYCIDGTKRKSVPVLELLLLADASGFEFLSKYFSERARKAKDQSRFRRLSQGPDPDDHDHLDSWGKYGDFNLRVSDSVAIRIGTLTNSNRRFVLKKYAISTASRRGGSMAPHLRALANEAERQIRIEETILIKRSSNTQSSKKSRSP